MIENIFLFNGLDKNEIIEIEKLFSAPVFFKKGEIIYSNNNFKKALGHVVNGKVSAVTDSLYKKSFSQDSVFGAAAVFGSDSSYVSKIIADTDANIIFLDEDMLKEIFERFPLTTINYIKFLSDKIRFLNNKLNTISCITAEDTVYKYLSLNMNSENIVNLPVNMTLLAKMLGLGRATLYRSFETLESNEKIKRGKNYIKVI